MPTQTETPKKRPYRKGMTRHPHLEEMKDLWLEGFRGVKIHNWLKKMNYPPFVQPGTINRHGERHWSHLAGKERQPADQEIADHVLEAKALFEEIQESGLGDVDRVSVSKTGFSFTVKQPVDTADNHIVDLPRMTEFVTGPRIPSDARRGASETSNGPLSILVVPDTQCDPGRPTVHLKWINKFALENYSGKPLTIVHLGDHWNMGSLSSYDKGKGAMEGRRYLADIKAGNRAMEDLTAGWDAEPLWEKHFLFGNHECLDENTQAITKDGPKYHWELKEGDLVLSCNDDLTELWLPIQAVHSYDYDGVMYSHHSRTGMSVTPNHRIVGFGTSAWQKRRDMRWKEHLASEFKSTCIPTTVINPKPDNTSFSDSDIRLIAWAFTDSFRSCTGKWTFYQSDPKHPRILDLLDEMGLSYTTTVRSRDTKEICGKILKSKPKASYDIALDREGSDYVDSLINSKKFLPECVWSWSSRQVKVFMNELVYTDGSIQPMGASKMIYHSRDTRIDLMNLFMRNGISCTLSEYAPGYWRINIVEREATRVEKDQMVTEPYSGKVWCITIENGRFYALANRRSGKGFQLQKPFLTGNSRTSRAVEDDIRLEGLLTTDHCLTPPEWHRHEFLEPVWIGGVCFSHYFYNPNTGKPYGSAIETRLATIGHSFVMGHQQGLRTAQRWVGGKQHVGVVCGSAYIHQEAYMGPQGRDYWRGIVMLNNVIDGSFDPHPISLDSLCRKYEGVSLDEFVDSLDLVNEVE